MITSQDSYRVIFLDIDGVLNSWDYFRMLGENNRKVDADEIDPVAVSRLQKIVRETDARIVISSSWRLIRTRDQLRELLRSKGLHAKIISETPQRMSNRPRGYEIREWLDFANQGTRRPSGIVILDDDADAGLGELHPWHVHTSLESGLQDQHVTEAIRILKMGAP